MCWSGTACRKHWNAVDDGKPGSILISKPLNPLLSRWLPVLLWAGFIFLASSDPNPYNHIPNRLYSWLWWTKLFGQSLIFYLGGLTHVLEYAILAYLLARALLWRGEFTRGQLLTAFYLVIFYAFTDEFHQVFTPGRAFQIIDLLMDALGVALGVGAYVLYLKRADVIRSRFMQRLREVPTRLRNLRIKPT